MVLLHPDGQRAPAAEAMRARLAAIGSTPGSHPLRAHRAPAGVSNCEVEVSISPDAFPVTYLRAARHRSAV